MVYSAHAPYEILGSSTMDFQTIQKMRRFARYWDLVVNSGNFVSTAPLIWQSGSPFARFAAFSDWLYARIGKTHAIALNRLNELIFEYLTNQLENDASTAAHALATDYQRTGRRDIPEFLKPHIPGPPRRRHAPKGPPRQQRHLA
jgi:hypothetical protein